jgi:hypothetical protein
MSDLPLRLSHGSHPVTYRARNVDPVADLRNAIEQRYVHVLFTDTRGGTELGFPLDLERSDWSGADWDARQGTVHVEGELRLDGMPIRCMADLDLSSLTGVGRVLVEDRQVSRHAGL